VPRLSSSIGVTNSTRAFGLSSNNAKDHLSSDVYETSADHYARENQWVKTAHQMYTTLKKCGDIGDGFLAYDRTQYSGPLFSDVEDGR
jgi:hypothetical protein